ncbi:Asp-tRNA(Asn)/Glu-tRNA(Gln) amidotransferase subunit GatB [Methylibium sp.]|uniref:Asp-tRNA(Asn)/Glu-tRNA(Gln) amidotransferase subunit GatB n=1 Tax=Methylibium sp. TaxID=2067992 RepID=UPI0017AD2214|nr:Asp-tRNA(Asn)/Glu-tRNA(Gln) amidotransferase subunit GatB [Methylibium sp.]MBA3591321.1 Asp-tRNA(Asn)/Glu-tRNA(Gln) amidotransferase subunit GatB [Methylibium sp.]
MSPPALTRGYEVVIGLETHTQLATASKIFSGASTAFGASPNTQASAVDLALPGTLPVLNRGAVERAIRLGLAVGGTIAPLSIFARKNYFYPDLPKGYQISQYELPVVQGGTVEFHLAGVPHSVRLTRAHLEEDAGKSVHEGFEDQSGIDLNRAGTPLLEIVSEPDMRSSKEAVEYAKALHALVVWLGICDGNMQEGSFRCDANVSVRRPGAPYGTRREIKNLNSFRHMAQAIDFEVQWQIDQIEDGLQVHQATVLFDAGTGETRAMRSKEDAHDYRYFPDPDLPPLVIESAWIERVSGEMPELPRSMAARFEREDGLAAADALVMTQSLAFARFYESVKAAGAPAKMAANWLMGEVSRRLNAEERGIESSPIAPETLAALIARIADGTVSNNGAKQVFDELWMFSSSRDAVVPGKVLPSSTTFSAGAGTAEVDAVIAAKGLKQLSDSSELERIVDAVLAANPKSVDEYRAGKDKAFNALVGQAMKASKGSANPAQLGELLKKKLA